MASLVEQKVAYFSETHGEWYKTKVVQQREVEGRTEVKVQVNASKWIPAESSRLRWSEQLLVSSGNAPASPPTTKLRRSQAAVATQTLLR